MIIGEKVRGTFARGETIWEIVARLCLVFSEKIVTKCTVPVRETSVWKNSDNLNSICKMLLVQELE